MSNKLEPVQERTSSLTPIISEEEFIPLVWENSLRFLSTLSEVKNSRIEMNKTYFSALAHEADLLEEFLDDHGARSNLRWLPFAELTASVRNFAIAGFHLNHIIERYSDYLKGENDRLQQDFFASANKTLKYFADVLGRFHEALANEADIPVVADDTQTVVEKWQGTVSPQLPFTIKGESAGDERERLISIAQSYRKVVKQFRQARLGRKPKAKTMSELVPGFVNETMASQAEGLLHNLQSEYDTYISGSDLDKNFENGRMLRGFTAIPMHLFETLRWLTHFYERHEHDPRHPKVSAMIETLVDDEKLYDCIVGFCLRFCDKYLAEGNKTAEALLTSFTRPSAIKLPTPKPQGFHARPATYVTYVVAEHGTDVFMLVGSERFDCRSVMDLMQAGGLLADLEQDEVVFEGDQDVLADLKILAENNYCEDREIPKQLRYIRIMRNL